MPLVNTFASIFFKQNRRRVDLYVKYPDETQFQVFDRLLKTAQNTEIGNRYNYKEIRSLGPQAFADRVPVNTYEGIKPDIEKVQQIHPHYRRQPSQMPFQRRRRRFGSLPTSMPKHHALYWQNIGNWRKPSNQPSW